ncbi:MAG TPA: thiamine phosphate synthase [Rhodanobacteraceae bacterium]|nr:thiamine phosphate synthase [Rhodanobacteraceae bacterium]
MPEPAAESAAWPPHGLYAITDGPRADLCDVARAALDGGAAVLQYRDKTRDRDRRLREARALAELCARFRRPLMVNDDAELARATGAVGVHLGEDDPGIGDARSILGCGAIIGVSCYDSLVRARDAAAAGADYLAFGAFFPTTSKAVTRRATPRLLREARGMGLPLVAIGGITPDNGRSLIAAGADFLAAISGVFGAGDIRAAARRYAAAFATDQHGQSRINGPGRSA